MSNSTVVAKTFRLRSATAARLKRLAMELDSYESPLLDTLINRAIDEIDRRHWSVKRVPVKYKISIDQ